MERLHHMGNMFKWPTVRLFWGSQKLTDRSSSSSCSSSSSRRGVVVEVKIVEQKRRQTHLSHHSREKEVKARGENLEAGLNFSTSQVQSTKQCSFDLWHISCHGDVDFLSNVKFYVKLQHRICKASSVFLLVLACVLVYLQCLCFDVSLSSVVSLCYNACPASCVKIKFLLKICTNMCSYQSTLMIQTDNWTASICPGKLDNSFCVGSVLHIWGGDLCGELSASHNCNDLTLSSQLTAIQYPEPNRHNCTHLLLPSVPRVTAGGLLGLPRPVLPLKQCE